MCRKKIYEICMTDDLNGETIFRWFRRKGIQIVHIQHLSAPPRFAATLLVSIVCFSTAPALTGPWLQMTLLHAIQVCDKKICSGPRQSYPNQGTPTLCTPGKNQNHFKILCTLSNHHDLKTARKTADKSSPLNYTYRGTQFATGHTVHDCSGQRLRNLRNNSTFFALTTISVESPTP